MAVLEMQTKIREGGDVIALTHVGLESLALHGFHRAITQRSGKGTANLNMSANFRCVKQQSASAALAAHGLGPWAV